MGMGDRKMKRYTKGLITGILLTASALPLIAQEDASGLTLEKDGEQVLIPLGEWVVVSSAYDPSNTSYFRNTVRGIYLGMTVDALRIQEKGESFEREIPMDEIGSVFPGKTKSTLYYVFQGTIVAGIGTLGFGVMDYLGDLSDDRNDPDDARSPASFANVFDWLLFPGMFTIPTGALIGFFRAQFAEGKAVEYVIGDGETL